MISPGGNLTRSRPLCARALKRSAFAPEVATVCADVLISADKRGVDSHGVGRYKPIYLDRIWAGILNPETTFDVIKETPTTAVVDGHNGMGLYIAKRSMELAIRKAEKFGLGMTVCRNSTHFGAAFYYARQAVEHGMIGMVTTNARPSIAPTWGVEPMLGTNPLTWVCLPTKISPLCSIALHR